MINVESAQVGRFTERDLELLTTLANAVSGVLARLLRQAKRAVTRQAEAGKFQSLTPRERVILRAICKGKTNKQIARQLKLKRRTVETHLQNIYRKLGVNSRLELAVWAQGQKMDERPT